MNIDGYKYYHFLGIGGIGMSALARYFKYQGKEVSGYDKTPTELTRTLEKEGIIIHYEDNSDQIPEVVKSDAENSLIIYTPAIPAGNECLLYFQENYYNLLKRAKVLGEITKGKDTIAVGGTHGKTSTTAMISHILFTAGIECYALLGGISTNYKTNFIFPKDKDNDIFVVEADEYDQSFLDLSPEIVIITSTDADHLDIYGNAENVLASYQEFVLRLKRHGTYIFCEDVKLYPSDRTSPKTGYGFSESNMVYAKNVKIVDGRYQFDLVSPLDKINGIRMNVPGEHNILNALAAFTAAKKMGIKAEDFTKAMRTFTGVKRRFEYIINTDEQVFIDDYAHHPQELNATIATLRKLYNGKKITGIFQPHLYSRTRDFAPEFASALSALDKVFLLDIYPAREEPIEGVTSQLIFDQIKTAEKFLCTKKELNELLKKEATEVVVTFGAGDIGEMVAPLKKILSAKK